MPKNANVNLPRGQWVQISDAAVSAITVQNIGAGTIILSGGSALPTDDAGIRLAPGESLSAATTLAQVFPGRGASLTVYARAMEAHGKVFVSHA